MIIRYLPRYFLRGTRRNERGFATLGGSFSVPKVAPVATCVAALLFAGLGDAAAAVRANASVQQSEMAVGQSNTYTITIRNAANTPQLERPGVPGLAFGRSASTRNATRIVNGVASRETSFSWSFQAERTGRFTIPGREIQVDGQPLRINEVVVEVEEMPAAMRERFSLRWNVPEGPFYVGQAIPATLQLYVRAGMNAGLGSHPDGSSDQFIRTDFPNEPRQRQERVDGRAFTVVEWDTVITPIRSGEGDLPVSLVLVYETGEVQREFFGPRAVQEQIRLTTPAYGWSVRDLPRAGRPESFSGAVGDFKIETSYSHDEVEVGEPITFSLQVRGEGNFERIQAPDFREAEGWRTYPPRAQMKEEGRPDRGVKTFDYILTPTSETVREAPAIAFSWFDPEEGAWQEAEIPPRAIKVHPQSRSSGGGRLAENETRDASAERDGPSLRPIATSPGRRQALLLPWRRPAFWVVNGGLGCLAAVFMIGIIRNRRAAQNPYLRVRSDAAREAKGLALQAVEAARRNDPLAFYSQARQSLRHFLAALDPPSHNPESLTWDDLETILRTHSFDEDSLARMRELFGRKDAVEFAGWRPGEKELEKDREIFEALLNQIVSRKR